MGMRRRIEERIERKEEEIRLLETQIKEAQAYVQAMQDTLRMLPRESTNAVSVEAQLKPDSIVAKTLALLRKANRPLHIKEILHGLGKQDSKKNRVSLAGSLGWYVRQEKLFSRPLPNTFSLIGKDANTEELPDDFGDMGDSEEADGEPNADGFEVEE